MVEQVACGPWHASDVSIDCLKMTRKRHAAIHRLEPCQALDPHARENSARVKACEVSVLFTLPRAEENGTIQKTEGGNRSTESHQGRAAPTKDMACVPCAGKDDEQRADASSHQKKDIP